MKKIGIVGGIGWASTVEYYRYICEASAEHFKNKNVEAPYPTPEIVIESMNIHHLRSLRSLSEQQNSWQEYGAYFRQCLENLKIAGADFGLLANNTSHQHLKQIKEDLNFEILSILDTTTQAVVDLNFPQALILGTSRTIKGEAYPEVLKEKGIDVVSSLNDELCQTIDQVIDQELMYGKTQRARELILKISKKYPKAAICLACTELPLAFPEHKNDRSFVVEGIQFVNTTICHAHKAFEKAVM